MSSQGESRSSESGRIQPLAVHNRVDAMRLFLRAANGGKLFERGDARLVYHEIFAVTHNGDAQRRAFVRDRGAHDQLNGAVFENLLFTARELRLRKLFRESRRQVRLLRVKRDQFAAAVQHGASLSINVSVVQPDD